jgi:LemA protein
MSVANYIFTGPAAPQVVRLSLAAARPRRAWVALLAASLLSGCGYSRIQELGEQAAVARSEIEVQVQRRAELVPVLVETVQRHAAVSEDVIRAVADARARLVRAVRLGDLAAIERDSGELSSVLEQLLSIAGGDMDLRTDPGFQLLRSQLEATEKEIREAGRSYNEAVRLYNDYISNFPQIVTAKVVGAERLQAFEPFQEPASPPVTDQ